MILTSHDLVLLKFKYSLRIIFLDYVWYSLASFRSHVVLLYLGHASRLNVAISLDSTDIISL